MGFLTEPDEQRLWLVAGLVLGVGALLLLTSLTFPWYTANYYSGASEVRGIFWFEEWDVEVYNNGEAGQDHPKRGYGGDSPFGDLMSVTRLLIMVGVVGFAGFGAALAAYYYGYLEQTGWIKAGWLVGFVGILGGLVWFSLRAGEAGAEQVYTTLLSTPNVNPTAFGPPDPKFWGTQIYINNELETAPGVGWLLAILALVNMVVGTLLLYRFPEPAPDAAEDLALDEGEAGDEGTRASRSTG